MKKRLVISLIFAAILYVALVETGFVGEILLKQINSRLNPRQLVLTAESPRASLMGFGAKAFSFKFPSALSSFDLADLHLAPRWLALFSGRIGADLRAIAYAGSIDAGVVASFKGVVQQLEVKISQLNLVQLPVAAIAGLSNGALDLDMRMERLDLVDQRSGRFRLELHNVVRPATQYSAIAELAALPDINLNQLILDGALNGRTIALGNLSAASDLGSVSGSGNLSLGAADDFSQIDLKLKFNLSPQGIATLGPLFRRSGDTSFAHLEPVFLVQIIGSPQARTVRMVKGA